MPLRPVIGIEVHAQLSTKTKLFCRCKTTSSNTPNSNTCPICLGLPGALPAFNTKVMEYAIKAGAALNCSVNETSEFARKNYFYPDQPKGYQITQFDKPICSDGFLEVENQKIRIKRVHIEEDAGKISHREKDSLVDFNRAGIPLIEIVTEPDVKTSKVAIEYMKNLRLILKYLDVCDGDMERGNFRCEANISMTDDINKLGVPVELKNINSFKAVQKAIEFEVIRQTGLIESGKTVLPETRGWDDSNEETYRMRDKETSCDYRYFPEPDLPTLNVPKSLIESIKKEIPELPQKKCERYQKDFGLSPYISDVISKDIEIAQYFEESIALSKATPTRIANLLMSEIFELSNDAGGLSELLITSKSLAKIAELIDNETISSKISKMVIQEVAKTGCDPEKFIEDNKLLLISDIAVIKKAVNEVLDSFPDEVASYRAGKAGLLGFFVGQVLKRTGGKADPKLANELLMKGLK